MNSCSQFSRRMHNLAAKFVRNVGAVHVVDPNVDFRSVFADLPSLEQNLKSRGIDCNVNSIAKDYSEWWAAFRKQQATVNEEGSDKQKNRAELLDMSEGLLSALQLPNDLHLNCIHGEKRQFDASAPQHLNWLKRRGMILTNRENNVLHLVGLPVILQNRIVSCLEEAFERIGCSRLSAPYVVRSAAVEAFNVPKERFPAFSSDSSQPLHLAGVCPLTLGSFFTKNMFSSSNSWPLAFYSTGMTYPHDNALDVPCSLYRSRQHMNVVLLVMARTESESEVILKRIISDIAQVLTKQFKLDFPWTTCPNSELFNYEMLAKVVSNDRADIIRWAKTGTYLSKRLNIVAEVERGAMPLQMDFVEVDVNALLGCLIETFLVDAGKEELPPVLSDCYQYLQ